MRRKVFETESDDGTMGEGAEVADMEVVAIAGRGEAGVRGNRGGEVSWLRGGGHFCGK